MTYIPRPGDIFSHGTRYPSLALARNKVNLNLRAPGCAHKKLVNQTAAARQRAHVACGAQADPRIRLERRTVTPMLPRALTAVHAVCSSCT